MAHRDTSDADSHPNSYTRSWINRLDDSSAYYSSQASTPLQASQLANQFLSRSGSASSSSSLSRALDLQDQEWEGDRSKAWVHDDRPSIDGPSSAQSLPPELLIHIFHQLPSNRDLVSAMLVSKAWLSTAFPLIWQKPSLSSVTQFTSFIRVLSQPVTMLPYSTIVRRLVFNSFARHLTDDLFRGVAYCRHLERLTLPGATRLTSASLNYVFGKLHDLIAIDLSGVHDVDDQVVAKIANNCPQVQGLNLSKCESITDEGVLAIASRLRMLRRIKLNRCKSLTDRSLVALALSCPLLLELDLAGVCQLSNDTTVAVFFNTSGLRELRLNDNQLISDKAIPLLSSVAWLNDKDLIDVVGAYPWYLTNAPHPKAMFRKWPCPPDLDMALVRPVTTSFDQLRFVDFTSCKQLGDQAIDNLITNAPQLRNISLAKCTKLTDASVESIMRLGKLLQYLHLGHVSNITDASITRLARSCTRLRYIDLANCSLLTDASVIALATNLPKLRRVGLVKVSNITDRGIIALAERHSTLERLHLSYCENVSVKVIAYLLNRLPLLMHLSLTGIRAFRTATLQQFCRSPPETFNAHQRASFCVYSGQGVVGLCNYLNSRLYESASEASSPRRGSESSTSSSVAVMQRSALDDTALDTPPNLEDPSVHQWVADGGQSSNPLPSHHHQDVHSQPNLDHHHQPDMSILSLDADDPSNISSSAGPSNYGRTA